MGSEDFVVDGLLTAMTTYVNTSHFEYSLRSLAPC